jgi:hypothetical protein
MWVFLLDLAPKFADSMMTIPFLTRWYRFMKTLIGRTMMPMAIETVSLISMNINIVRQPPMQIMLFMKPESTEKPQKRAAIA